VNEAVLEVRGLWKRFQGVTAVRNASFALGPGRISVFLGENGAGKTTTIKLVLGFLRGDSGEIDLRARRIGYVPERPVFPAWLSGEEILSCTGRLHGLSRAGVRCQEEALCRRISFDAGLLGRKASSYSEGNRKKLAYLQSLLISPELLIVDEPFATLDPVSIRDVHALFRDLRDIGTTQWLSSHLLPHLEPIYDDVIVIRRGEILLRRSRGDLGLERKLEDVFFTSIGSAVGTDAPGGV
jgi:ABC-2 type transport system ATP-binding protein